MSLNVFQPELVKTSARAASRLFDSHQYSKSNVSRQRGRSGTRFTKVLNRKDWFLASFCEPILLNLKIILIPKSGSR